MGINPTSRVPLLTFPAGWHSCIDHLNHYPDTLVAEVCHEVIAFLQYSKGKIDAEHFAQKLQSSGVESSSASVCGTINALSFLFRSAAQHGLSEDELKTQLQSAGSCSEITLSAITKVWTDQRSPLIAALVNNQKALDIGKLVDFKWKLGLAMSSSSSRSLNSPFVAVSLKVASTSGEVISYSFEMTVPEFKSFSSHIKDIVSVMDTV
ncbi:hypothetical protein BSL78_10792 [Apostichopus japonicus]|uniref:COMM domain-containing protein 6 n=1 Tax=Stichopus japonicus TaxID=307972 RepID=A0A2G8KWL5_STIJA|nr:hypothetical protein BSL78_10792 [Apostichopus japonicus]